MTTPELSAALLRVIEGCKLKAYWDKTGKVWTIGFGRAHGISEGTVISFDTAVEMLAEDSTQLLKMVAGRPVIEASAQVSFGYNCGAAALARVMSGESDLLEFTKSGGKELPGLVARRQLEAALIEASRERSA